MNLPHLKGRESVLSNITRIIENFPLYLQETNSDTNWNERNEVNTWLFHEFGGMHRKRMVSHGFFPRDLDTRTQISATGNGQLPYRNASFFKQVP